MNCAILDILGFFDVESYINVDSNPCIATRPANVLNAMPRQLFIYSDICEPCLVGDVQSPFLHSTCKLQRLRFWLESSSYLHTCKLRAPYKKQF